LDDNRIVGSTELIQSTGRIRETRVPEQDYERFTLLTVRRNMEPEFFGARFPAGNHLHRTEFENGDRQQYDPKSLERIDKSIPTIGASQFN
jgi:hypothetical protein